MARLFTPSESKYYLMALDAGTGSIRAVIFDLEGNQIAVGQAEWRHLAVPDVPGSMEFDLNKNWQLACECMRQALHNAGIAPEYIAAVSACSMPPPTTTGVPAFRPQSSAACELTTPSNVPVSLTGERISARRPAISSNAGFQSRVVRSRSPVVPALEGSTASSPLSI